MKKRLVSILLAVTMLLGLLPAAALAVAVPEGAVPAGEFTIWATDGGTLTTGEEANNDYSYDDGLLTILSSTKISIANTDPEASTADHIVVPAGITANITLAGVSINTSDAEGSAFRIYSANNEKTTVNLTLAAGTENVLKSATQCAGLQNSIFSTLTIYGSGSLSATGGSAAAGIGGGRSTNSQQGNDATNIANGGTIIIEGGVITAQGGQFGSGIGDGDYQGTKSPKVGSHITISGGIVTAKDGGIESYYRNPDDIGKGSDDSTGHIFSTGESGNAIIITGDITNSADKSDWHCILFDKNNTEGVVYGEVMLAGDLTIAEGQTLTIPDGATLTIPEDKTLTIDGTLSVVGTLSGNVINNGTIYLIDDGDITAATIDGNETSVADVQTGALFLTAADGEERVNADDYTYDNHIITIKSGKAITISGNSTADRIEIAEGITANITLADVNIDTSGASGSAVDVKEGAALNLTLAAGTENVLKSGGINAGIHVPFGATLTLDGSGNLTSTGSSSSNGGGAGIGGNGTDVVKGSDPCVNFGSITLSASGNLTSTGGKRAAGIGGGGYMSNDVTLTGSITIQSGVINAAAGQYAAGIGGGADSPSSITFTITGGYISISQNEANAIGGGYRQPAADLSDVTGAVIIFSETKKGQIYGNSFTLTQDAEVPSGVTLTVDNSQTLTIDSGVTLTNNGTIRVRGAVEVNGMIQGSGKLDFGTSVIYDANGGTGSVPEDTTHYFRYDTVNVLFAPALTREGYYFLGWSTDREAENAAYTKGGNENFFVMSNDNTTLYAVWSKEPPCDITGRVTEATDTDPSNAAYAYVRLMRGNTVVAETGADKNGDYSMPSIHVGEYNLVVSDVNGKIKTTLVALTGGSQTVDVQMPASNLNSMLKVKPNTPVTLVGGLDKEAESQFTGDDTGKFVDVTMTVESKADVTDSTSSDDEALKTAQTAIKALAKQQTMDFVDLSVAKTVGDYNSIVDSPVLETNGVLEILVEYPTAGYSNITVYRNHTDGDGITSTQALEKLSSRPTDSFTDGTFFVGDGYIAIYAQKFSVYAIGYNLKANHSKFRLSFDTNGGSNISSVSVSKGSTISLSGYGTTKDGYTFAGWYSDSELTNKVTSVKLTKNTTVYAKWTENVVAPSMPFTDVKENDWFYDDVKYAHENGLMNGTGESAFSPDDTTTRGMIVTILYRLEGEPAVTGTNTFDDVKSGSYYEKAITWAAANEIAGGYGDGIFGPDDSITREQLAAILYRYASFKGYDVTGQADLSKFSDYGQIGSYALTSLAWANATGLVNGRGDGIIDPTGNALRCEVAAILHRFCENIAK